MLYGKCLALKRSGWPFEATFLCHVWRSKTIDGEWWYERWWTPFGWHVIDIPYLLGYRFYTTEDQFYIVVSNTNIVSTFWDNNFTVEAIRHFTEFQDHHLASADLFQYLFSRLLPEIHLLWWHLYIDDRLRGTSAQSNWVGFSPWIKEIKPWKQNLPYLIRAYIVWRNVNNSGRNLAPFENRDE